MILEKGEIEIQGRKLGTYLPELDLWLDPKGSKDLAFISHAHADHFSRPKRAICSKETAYLLEKRFGLDPSTFLIVPYDEVLCLENDWEIRLTPAGHILGSSMLHLTRKSDSASLLYTGDFKTKPSRTAETAIGLSADTLIMETSFGKPEYQFPPRELTEQAILRFVEQVIENNELPVLCAYALGKAQELTALLDSNSYNVAAHSSVIEMNEACRGLGLTLPQLLPWNTDWPKRTVLICPPSVLQSQKLRRIKRKRTAMISGWGIQPSARYRYQVDEVFPLSDHADYEELHNFVERINPNTVYTVHGFTQEFAAELRAKGRKAWSLFSADQLEWNMMKPVTSASKMNEPVSDVLERPLTVMNEMLNQVAETSSRLTKRDSLANIILSLADDEMVSLLRWLSCRPLKLGVGYISMRMALQNAYGLNLAELRRISDQQPDLSRTARIIATNHAQVATQPFEIRAFEQWMDRLRNQQKSLHTVYEIAALIQTISPSEVEFVYRVMAGEFRMGIASGMVEEAIASAFHADLSELAKAHMLSGDLGKCALLAKYKKLSDVTLNLGTPVKVMLATAALDSSAVIEKMSDEELWTEDKFDGIRAQLHVSAQEAHLFSRDLRSLDAEFPEIIAMAKGLPDCLLDGEIIAYEEGKRLSFFDLQKRLGRKNIHRGQQNLFEQSLVPVRYIAFDLLHFEGENLWNHSLEERRNVLDTIPFFAPFEKALVNRVRGQSNVEEAFKAARTRGNEGLMIKDPKSFYQFGKRGQAWLKLKKFDVSLDCVVVRAQQGHGRRSGVLSDYTFALRDEKTGNLCILGKAYSGLTDLEIEDLTEFFEKTTIETHRKVRFVEPQLVLEIAFDSIRSSPRHDSGLALRFPRIKSIRRDKSVAEIDTLQFAKSLL